MKEGASLDDHLTAFKKIVSDLENMEVKYDEGDLRLTMLNSLPSLYSPFTDTILSNHDTFTLNEVYDTFFSKEKMKKLVISSETQAESLVIGGRSLDRSYGSNENDKSKLKSKP